MACADSIISRLADGADSSLMRSPRRAEPPLTLNCSI